MPKHFEYIGPSPELTHDLAQVLADSIRTRISRGLDVNDQAAPALDPKYARTKSRRGLSPIRDWRWTGRTLAAIGPLDRADGRIAVGFNDARAAKVAAIQNARCQQFGVSPEDRRKLIAAVNQVRGQFVRAA